MRDSERGIISYAGFDKTALWKQAKQALGQGEGEGTSRFSSLLPLFPVELVQSMPYVGEAASGRAYVSPSGFSIDPCEYHRRLYAQMPELYTDDNYRRNFDYENRFVGRGVFTVDQTWATYFPQYQPFMGERLTLYMLGGGGQAAAVPESIYPKGCGVLSGAETDMRITVRAEHYAAYVRRRVQAGESFDDARFEADYLEEFQLTPVSISQKELGRVMQDLSIVRSLEGEALPDGLFTEYAKRAENIAQYAPNHIACDTFESAPITRSTARLMQLYYQNEGFISDLWLPYQEASEYVDKQAQTLDVQALCAGFQIPPRYDPETGGGRYPDQARVVIVRDRNLRPMVADTLNNPAYGSGMSPLGMINKLVLLRDSEELLRLNKLALEDPPFRCQSAVVSAMEYRQMLGRAALQEVKGRLIDCLYRREGALSQLQEGSPAYHKLKALMDWQVETMETRVGQESRGGARSQLSGYDADIDYLRRLRQSKTPPPEDEPPKPLVFAPDPLRMMSIESGFAMRGGLCRYDYGELALPEAEEDEPGEQEAVMENDGEEAEGENDNKAGRLGEEAEDGDSANGNAYDAEQPDGEAEAENEDENGNSVNSNACDAEQPDVETEDKDEAEDGDSGNSNAYDAEQPDGEAEAENEAEDGGSDNDNVCDAEQPDGETEAENGSSVNSNACDAEQPDGEAEAEAESDGNASDNSNACDAQQPDGEGEAENESDGSTSANACDAEQSEGKADTDTDNTSAISANESSALAHPRTLSQLASKAVSPSPAATAVNPTGKMAQLLRSARDKR